MGNIIPESMMMGIISTIADNNNAINWVFAMVETSKPRDNAKRIYIVDTKKIENTEPCMGTSNTNVDIRSITIRIAKANTK